MSVEDCYHNYILEVFLVVHRREHNLQQVYSYTLQDDSPKTKKT